MPNSPDPTNVSIKGPKAYQVFFEFYSICINNTRELVSNLKDGDYQKGRKQAFLDWCEDILQALGEIRPNDFDANEFVEKYCKFSYPPNPQDDDDMYLDDKERGQGAVEYFLLFMMMAIMIYLIMLFAAPAILYSLNMIATPK